MVHFFHKQEHDEAGHLAVRLQKAILGMFFIAFIWTVLGFVFISMYGGYGVFWGGLFGWFVMFCGFYGSYKRNPGLLMTFIICQIIEICFFAFYFIFTAIAAGELASLCGLGGCAYANFRGIIAVMAIQLICVIFWFAMQIYTTVLASRLRRLVHGHHVEVHVHHGQAYAPVVGYQYQPAPPVYQA
eukprot:TRINITY_DN754_c0_g1_i1.p2 TRINITY_DN754_c0_g1~~TRINITY_DN754_c0_g1_i1.p2  ORF type:complete len:186 (+),score=29.76 TRINITY_DN754_c0_g1_i1:181-738(+)